MRGHPFRQVGIDGHQLDAEPDAHQKAQKDHPLRLLLKRQQQREGAIPDQGEHKGGAAAEAIGVRAQQAGADEQAKKGGGGEGRLVRYAEDALRAGVENAVGDKAGADITGLEKIVEFEKAAQRQQNNKAPQAGRRGQGVDSGRQIPRMDRRRRYRVTHH